LYDTNLEKINSKGVHTFDLGVIDRLGTIPTSDPDGIVAFKFTLDSKLTVCIKRAEQELVVLELTSNLTPLKALKSGILVFNETTGNLGTYKNGTINKRVPKNLGYHIGEKSIFTLENEKGKNILHIYDNKLEQLAEFSEKEVPALKNLHVLNEMLLLIGVVENEKVLSINGKGKLTMMGAVSSKYPVITFIKTDSEYHYSSVYNPKPPLEMVIPKFILDDVVVCDYNDMKSKPTRRGFMTIKDGKTEIHEIKDSEISAVLTPLVNGNNIYMVSYMNKDAILCYKLNPRDYSLELISQIETEKNGSFMPMTNFHLKDLLFSIGGSNDDKGNIIYDYKYLYKLGAAK
jgi:hypothetical protein